MMPILRQRKTRFAPMKDIFNYPELPAASSLEQEAKYLVIKCAEIEKQIGEDIIFKSLNTYNPFKLQTAIRDISKNIIRGSYLRDGSLLILVKDRPTAERFISRDSLVFSAKEKIKVEITYHKTLNSVKGVIYCPSLIHVTEDEIVEGLKGHLVTEARHIKRRTDTSTRNTGAVILTFNRYHLPKQIDIMFQRFDVREFINNPMRCLNCQLLGHTKVRCKAEPVCAKCGESSEKEGHAASCKDLYCVNCKTADHSSADKGCPTFIKEKEILAIMNRVKCSKFEARKQYYSSRTETCLDVGKKLNSTTKTNPVSTLSFAQILTNKNQNNRLNQTNSSTKSKPQPTNPKTITPPTPSQSQPTTSSSTKSKPLPTTTVITESTNTTPKNNNNNKNNNNKNNTSNKNTDNNCF